MFDLRFMMIAVSLILAGIAFAGDDSATATFWRTEDGATVVEFSPCGEKYCGYIIAILDERISAADSDALCRLQILGALLPEDNGRWSKGWLLDPETESVYKVSTRVDETAMTLRVFETVEAWGVDIRWARVDRPAAFCDATASGASYRRSGNAMQGDHFRRSGLPAGTRSKLETVRCAKIPRTAFVIGSASAWVRQANTQTIRVRRTDRINKLV